MLYLSAPDLASLKLPRAETDKGEAVEGKSKEVEGKGKEVEGKGKEPDDEDGAS